MNINEDGPPGRYRKEWDVNKYRIWHENEEHWKLKEDFMLAIKYKFPEEKVVSLAQMYYNYLVLGCM